MCFVYWECTASVQLSAHTPIPCCQRAQIAQIVSVGLSTFFQTRICVCNALKTTTATGKTTCAQLARLIPTRFLDQRMPRVARVTTGTLSIQRRAMGALENARCVKSTRTLAHSKPRFSRNALRARIWWWRRATGFSGKRRHTRATFARLTAQ